jgi:CubicO group peptidase (beta-lactamase class C family)
VFPASSISKAFTAAVALSLVRDGLLRLDESANSQMTSWQIPDNEYTAKSEVTLLRLLDHSAGVNRPSGGFGYEEEYPSTIQILNGEHPATNPPAQVECVPGTEIRYSNFGYIVIQQLIEDVSKRPFAALARELVLEPSNMRLSTFEQPLPAELETLAAFPHDEEGRPEARTYNPNALGQGGLWTNPADLARFTIEIMRSAAGDPSSALPPEITRAMLTPGDRNLVNGKFWGLGFIVLGKWAILQAGSDPGFRSLLAAFPGEGKGIVVMVNGDGGELLQLRLLLNFIIEYLLLPRIWSIVAGALCLLLLLSALLLWPISYLAGRLKKWWSGVESAGREQRALPMVARILAAINVIMILVAIFLYGRYFIDPAGPLAWSDGLASVRLLLVLTLACAGLSWVLIYLSTRSWKSHYWTLMSRVHFSLVSLAALAAGLFALNLVGIL